VIGKVALVGTVGRHRLNIDGIVTKHVSQIVLGMDWLRKNRVCWRFAEIEIEINRATLMLKARPLENWCRRIVVADSRIIAPVTETIVNTTVECNSLHDESSKSIEWATEVGEPVCGLIVSRTLIPARLADVPVRVMNISTRPLALKVGKVMSILQPVVIIQKGQLPPSTENLKYIAELKTLVDGVDDDVDEEVKLKLFDSLCKYSGVLSFSADDLCQTDTVKHAIETGNARPVRQP